MMMFIQLLVFTCACALGATDEVPPYMNILKSIKAAVNLLENNILSMDGNVPLLNDPRRHYAEIIYVVNDEALNEMRCSSGTHEYYNDYQKNINIAAPFAIANPQSVVNGTNKMMSQILDSIDEVLQLIQASAHHNTQDCDNAVAEEIKNNAEKYGRSQEVFFAAGLFATQLNQDHEDYFAASSQNLSAHNFLVTGAPKLEKIVEALKNLYVVYQHHC